MKRIPLGQLTTLILIVAAFVTGIVINRLTPQHENVGAPPTNTKRAIALAVTATETIPPNTPLASITPSATLLPPPTFEPPTLTLPPSLTPSITPTQAIDLSGEVPGLIGLESPTSIVPEGCQPRKDWKLTYTVQRNDALIRIADLYNTSVNELLKGNCLSDKNVIVIGQVLKVPGKTQPVMPQYACVPYDIQSPYNGLLDAPITGNMTFVWHGPLVPYTLLRVRKPDNLIWEDVIPLRQNESVEIAKNFAMQGTFYWQLFPLDSNFVQVCPESAVYTFTKLVSPTLTPTPSPHP